MGYYKKVVQNIWGTSGALKKVRRAAITSLPNPFNEYFTGANGSALNSNYWVPNGANPMPSIQDNHCSVITDVAARYALIKFPIAGACTIHTNWGIINGPAINAWGFWLQISQASPQRSARIGRIYESGQHAWHSDCTIDNVFFRDNVFRTDGALGIVRAANGAITLRYKLHTTDWFTAQSYGAGSFSGTDLRVMLYGIRISGTPTATFVFDEFSITQP